MVYELGVRKQVIFNNPLNNPLMECAIFLDPRFRQMILCDEPKVERVKITLIKIWQRINVNQSEGNNSANSSGGSSLEFDEDAELNKYLSEGC